MKVVDWYLKRSVAYKVASSVGTIIVLGILFLVGGVSATGEGGFFGGLVEALAVLGPVWFVFQGIFVIAEYAGGFSDG